MIVGVLASVFAVLAAGLHVWIFVMESITWQTPRTWRRFGVRDQTSADILRPMAYNQGFYNLFLAVGAVVGVVLFWTLSPVAGRTLALFTLAAMVAAALVLVSGGRRYARAAAFQGTLPLVGAVLFALA